MNTYRKILKEYWGYDSFRGIQEEIIANIGSGHDTLGLMPTGGGKSVTFQVPALAMEGTCIVVTPLIALMKDQVQNLRQRGIKATAVYSGLTRREILTALDNCILGDYKFLYVSPERLGTELFRQKLCHMHISFITVDEAHCISQWGYDFRPSYLHIADLRELLPDAPVLALTATATPDVVNDICQRLKFREGSRVCRMSFARENLSYIVRQAEDKDREMLHILNRVDGSAIIYVRNRKGTKETAKYLNENGFTATFYHAGLANSVKDERQQAWQRDEVRVMVATNAFGMGIDKPDVRLVIHLSVPDSPEAYFQEAGRAGRDGLRAYAVLLYHRGDRSKLLRHVPETFPDKEFIRDIYEHLAYYFQMAMGDGYMVTREFNLEEFCRTFKHFPTHTYSALKLLTQAGYIEYTDEQDNASRIMFLVRRDDLYRLETGSEQSEEVIRALLRAYGGLFADYVYIEEALLARMTGLTEDQVYHILVGLNHVHLVHYVPRKRTPYVTYTQKRVERERIVIPPAVYEERKERLEQRIHAMISYCEADRCRSRMLLEYFGEQSNTSCGCCDVCLKRKASGPSDEELCQVILEWLDDGEDHLLTEMPDPVSSDRMQEILRRLIAEEKIVAREGLVRLNRP